MNTETSVYLVERRRELERALGKPLSTNAEWGARVPLTDAERSHLLEEAQELYWNELEWENITSEEQLDDGSLTELAFPGLLAFVRGLLLREALPDAGASAVPRPEVVEDLLHFLADRVMELERSSDGPDGEDAERARAERAMTSQLVNLILLRLHEVDPGEL